MYSKTEQILLTIGVVGISLILIALSLYGFSLTMGLLIICVTWAVYFLLMVRK
ncbi:MAG: hypothetical protein LUQ32_06980 [Methanomicrobiales archaeon]|nr:hypothetical protein [Methanomicrobiales archaeon]